MTEQAVVSPSEITNATWAAFVTKLFISNPILRAVQTGALFAASPLHTITPILGKGMAAER